MKHARPRVLALGAVGLVLVLVAATVLALQVRVQSSGVDAACGSPFDVISGRATWEDWFAQDLTDPRVGPRSPLVRTDACPAAVNRRTASAGTLAAAAALLGAAAVLLAARDRARHARPARVPLRRLGAWVSGIGAGLTIAGVVALGVLLANPDAALFLYVDRWVIAIVGLILLVPAVVLTVGGRALMLAAEPRDDRPDEW